MANATIRLILVALMGTSLWSCGESSSRVSGPNLLVIAVDTLRADHLGAYGYDRPTSPAIDRLFDESIVFDDAHSSSPWTLPSFASLLTSTYSSTHGCWQFSNSLAPSFTTLTELMSDAGYHTEAIVSHVFLGRKYGLGQGFDVYDDSLVQSSLDQSHKAITSSIITERAQLFLERESGRSDRRPWFLFLHYFDPHTFYQAHEEFVEQFGAIRSLDRYDGEIAYTDKYVGKVLELLDREGFTQNTIVVFVSDHGEEFMDHGGRLHGTTLFQEVVRVPFAIRVPGLEPRRVSQPVRGVDFMPTILDLLDIPAGSLPMAGRSLRTLMEGGKLPEEGALVESRLNHLPAFRLEAFILDKWKLILKIPRRKHRDKPTIVYLFDREQDPLEQKNLAKENGEIVKKMVKLLKKNVNGAADVAAMFEGTGRELELSAEELERLKELGYLADTDLEDDGDGNR